LPPTPPRSSPPTSLHQQRRPGGPREPARQGGEDETIGLAPADNLHLAFKDADLVAQNQQLGLISGAVAEGCEGEVDEESEAGVKDEDEHERRLIVAGLAGPMLSSDGLSAPHTLSEEGQAFLVRQERWRSLEGGYSSQQATYPQTLAYGLTDSPAGLAAWIVDKFRAWSDCDGDPERRFTKDELLTNLTIYWATGCINSSFLFYYDSLHDPEPSAPVRVEVPVGVALFPKENPVTGPRDWAELMYNVVRWTEMPRGGHFAAAEEPVLLAAKLREFFRPLR
jgi:pimeloyl-ACP methyl ester carboxylesterase